MSRGTIPATTMGIPLSEVEAPGIYRGSLRPGAGGSIAASATATLHTISSVVILDWGNGMGWASVSVALSGYYNTLPSSVASVNLTTSGAHTGSWRIMRIPFNIAVSHHKWTGEIAVPMTAGTSTFNLQLENGNQAFNYDTNDQFALRIISI